MAGKAVRRVLRVAKLFVVLRLAEIAFAILAFMLAGSVLTLIVSEGAFNPEDILEDILQAFRIAVAISLGYLLIAFYLPFVVLCFFLVEVFRGITEGNIRYVNAFPYPVHSFVFMIELATRPEQIGIWLVWAAITVFNFFSPRWLSKVSWLKLRFEDRPVENGE